MLLWYNSDVFFPILHYLNRANISWMIAEWGGSVVWRCLRDPVLAVFMRYQRVTVG